MEKPVRRRGAFIVEYSWLLAVVIAALVMMGIYLKRGLSGRWREVGDTFGQGRQYEPGLSKRGGKLF